MIRPLLLICTVLVVFSVPSFADDKAKTEAKIEVGKPAPDFTLKDQDGKDVKLSSFLGKQNVLVAFYPKDFTGG